MAGSSYGRRNHSRLVIVIVLSRYGRINHSRVVIVIVYVTTIMMDNSFWRIWGLLKETKFM